MELIQSLGCIQYDPVNVVGRNPDLVLQSRIRDYQPAILNDLLYQDRLLWDGWDKQSSIHSINDWHYFKRYRDRMIEQYNHPDYPPMKVADLVREEIRKNGAADSLRIKHDTKIDWWWGRPVSIIRACLEVLYVMGELGIHHRNGTRRYFDLVERLVPADILNQPDPNPTLADYHDWHVLRRLGSLGFARVGAVEGWLGITGMKTPERTAALHRLVEKGDVLVVGVDELPGKEFFIRRIDWDDYQERLDAPIDNKKAALLPPLDNLLWDRTLLRWLFDFEYVWEVYKVQTKRKYGHYTMPVLYGDRFVGRLDARVDKKTNTLVIDNWWWENGVNLEADMRNALQECIHEFGRYLSTEFIRSENQSALEIL